MNSTIPVRHTLTILTILLILVTVTYAHGASGACKGQVINPVTDICWQCMFPVKMGGISYGNGAESAPGNITSPVCACPSGNGSLTIGVSTAFWEHARLIETVKDPFCFPVMGTGMTNPKPGFSSGEVRSKEYGDSDYAFQQVHFFYFPAWSILRLFMDFPCAESRAFDLAYMTEVDPMWNDDSLSFIINPEALLFGNPISQLACVADSVAATISQPIDPLFWCMGSWGSFYPLTGSMIENNPLNVNAGLAARLLFKLGRETLMYDTGINQCSSAGVVTPILVKSNYRIQIARPVRGNDCIPIGRPSLIWGAAKNPPFGTATTSPDNFLWSLTRRRVCCVGYTLD
jgi:conjugal transfer pilus assembly protein TraU